MITGILQTVFWVGCVLLVALCAGAFWLSVNALIDRVLLAWSARFLRRSGVSCPVDRQSGNSGRPAADGAGATTRRTAPTYDFDQGVTLPSLRGVVDETRLPLVLVPRRREQIELCIDSPWNKDGTRKQVIH